MNRIIGSSVLCVLFSVSAFAQNLESEVVRKAYSVADELNQKSGRMNPGKLQDINVRLDEIKDLIQGRGQGGGGGGRPGRGGMSFRGMIEQTTFDFNARDLGDVFESCETLVVSKVGASVSVDDISLSLDFGNEMKIRNSSSYWKGPYQVCMQLVNVARQAGLRSREAYLTVVGKVEDREIRLAGNTLRDLNQQCESFVNNTLGSSVSVDDIELSINYEASITKRNSSSYWKGPFEVCQQVLSSLR